MSGARRTSAMVVIAHSHRGRLGRWPGGSGTTLYYHLDSLFNFAAGQQHTTPTAEAFQPDVGAQPHHPPLIAATGMRLAQPHTIAQTEIGEFHDSPPSTGASGSSAPRCWSGRYSPRREIYERTGSGVR